MRKAPLRVAAGIAILVPGLVAPLAASPVRLLGRAQGLPSVQVHAIAQDARGFIWMAGPGGLARFDGVRVVRYGRRHGLSTQGLRSLVATPDGRIWIGSDAGVDVMQPDGSIAPLLAPEEWDYGFADALAAGPEGDVWIASSLGGLLRWSRSNGLTTEQPLAGVFVRGLVATPDGDVWATAPEVGLVHRGDGSWGPPRSDEWKRAGKVTALGLTPSGTLVVAGVRGVVEIDATGRALRFMPLVGPEAPVGAIAVTADELWLAVDDRLYRATPLDGEWSDPLVALAPGPVNQLLVDRDGDLWAGTDNRGVAEITALRRVVATLARPCVTQVSSIRRLGSRLLVGGDQCSWTIDLSAPERPPRPIPALAGMRVWDLLSRDGALWAATEHGLARIAPGASEAVLVAPQHPVLGAPGRVLLERDGELWVGTVRGLARIADTGIESVSTDANRPLGYVYTLAEDPMGRLWVGTIGGGVLRETGNGLERYRSALVRPRSNVYAIAFRADGVMAIAQDDRVVIVDGSGERTLDPAADDTVAGWAAAFASGGDLWIGGSSGLVRYDADTGRIRHHLTAAAGLAGEEFTTSRSVAVLPDGRVACGLSAGMSLVSPGAFDRIPALPPVQLAEVVWDRAELLPGEPTRVGHGRWTLDLSLFTPWFAAGAPPKVRTRLAGYDPAWSELTDDFDLRYTALPAGRYSLEAQAWSELVGWGPESRLLEFEVTPPWWRRGWFWALGLAALGLATGLAWQAWNRRLIRYSTDLEGRVRARTAELREANTKLAEANRMKDEMLGTVAHDLRNPIANIRAACDLLLAGIVPPGDAYLDEVRRMRRSSVRVSNLIDDLLDVARIEAGTIELRKQDVAIRDYLEEMVQANRRLGDLKEITLALTVDDDVPTTAPIDPERLWQVIDNLVSNALKFSGPGTVVAVRARREDGWLAIEVADEGIGIPEEDLDRLFDRFQRGATRAPGGERGTGLGLAISRQLVVLHGGRIDVESEVGRGSRFRFTIPLGNDHAGGRMEDAEA